MNNNAIIRGMLEIPEVRLGLIDFAIRCLDCAKAYLLKKREPIINEIAELKKSNKLVA